MKPNLVKFSKDIDLTSGIAVISFVLVPKHSIGNKKTTLLHMADEQPKILRRTLQLLTKLEKTFSYTEDIERYIQENNKSKMVFASNIWSVNGMEFDHAVIIVSQAEYFLQHYLPQAISRCTFDLKLVLLPKENESTKGPLQKLSNIFSRTKNEKNKETVTDMIEELKLASLVKQLVVAECKNWEENNSCYSISNETDNNEEFEVHSHSDQYKKHLESYAELLILMLTPGALRKLFYIFLLLCRTISVRL